VGWSPAYRDVDPLSYLLEEAGCALDALDLVFVGSRLDRLGGKDLDTVNAIKNDAIHRTGRGDRAVEVEFTPDRDRRHLTGVARGVGGPHPVTIIRQICENRSPKFYRGFKIASREHPSPSGR